MLWACLKCVCRGIAVTKDDGEDDQTRTKRQQHQQAPVQDQPPKQADSPTDLADGDITPDPGVAPESADLKAEVSTCGQLPQRQPPAKLDELSTTQKLALLERILQQEHQQELSKSRQALEQTCSGKHSIAPDLVVEKDGHGEASSNAHVDDSACVNEDLLNDDEEDDDDDGDADEDDAEETDVANHEALDLPEISVSGLPCSNREHAHLDQDSVDRSETSNIDTNNGLGSISIAVNDDIKYQNDYHQQHIENQREHESQQHEFHNEEIEEAIEQIRTCPLNTKFDEELYKVPLTPAAPALICNPSQDKLVEHQHRDPDDHSDLLLTASCAIVDNSDDHTYVNLDNNKTTLVASNEISEERKPPSGADDDNSNDQSLLRTEPIIPIRSQRHGDCIKNDKTVHNDKKHRRESTDQHDQHNKKNRYNDRDEVEKHKHANHSNYITVQIKDINKRRSAGFKTDKSEHNDLLMSNEINPYGKRGRRKPAEADAHVDDVLKRITHDKENFKEQRNRERKRDTKNYIKDGHRHGHRSAKKIVESEDLINVGNTCAIDSKYRDKELSKSSRSHHKSLKLSEIGDKLDVLGDIQELDIVHKHRKSKRGKHSKRSERSDQVDSDVITQMSMSGRKSVTPVEFATTLERQNYEQKQLELLDMENQLLVLAEQLEREDDMTDC